MKMVDQKTYSFFTDNVGYEVIESKGEKKYYITGYISTKDKDLLNDIVTDEALDNMLNQLSMKNIKLDVEHEAWREENPTIVPVGRIIESKRDERGIFVKAELNKANSRFKEVWNSIKEGFLDAFSIAYKTISSVHKKISGEKVRMLNNIELLNVAITGNPVNPEAKMINVFTKSLNDIQEETNMVEDNIEKVEETTETTEEVEETPTEEATEEVEEKSEPEVEEESEPEVEEKDEEEPAEEEEEVEVEEKAKLQKDNKELKTKLKELEAEVKDLKERLEKPIIKSEVKSLEKAELKAEIKDQSPLDMI